MMVGTRTHLSAPAHFVFPWEHCAHSSNFRTAFQGGRHRLSVRYREKLKNANLHAMQQRTGAPLEVDCQVWIKVWHPDARKRDASNYAKLILDAMEGVAYTNDRLVRDLRVTNMGVDRSNPRIEAHVDEFRGVS